jgi:hypothetical protein
MVFRNASGFGHTQSNGSIAWIDNNPADGSVNTSCGSVSSKCISTTTQEDWRDIPATGGCPISAGNTGATSKIATTYNCAAQYDTSTMFVMGAFKKGYDREMAPFGTANRGNVSAQRCGLTWIEGLQEPTNWGWGTSMQLPYLLAATWDDYDEGHAFGMGIESCWTVSTSASGRTLNWSLAKINTAEATTYATTSVLDHFTVYASKDAPGGTVNLQVLADNIPIATTSLDLMQYGLPAGTWYFYVKVVAKPGLLNKASSQTASFQPHLFIRPRAMRKAGL